MTALPSAPASPAAAATAAPTELIDLHPEPADMVRLVDSLDTNASDERERTLSLLLSLGRRPPDDSQPGRSRIRREDWAGADAPGLPHERAALAGLDGLTGEARGFTAWTLQALAAAIAPKSPGSSTSGGKKSVVETIATSGLTW